MAKRKSASKPRKPRAAVAHFIREWRLERGFSQARLAEAAGVSTSAISQIETGDQGFTFETLQVLAVALNVHPAWLLGRNPADPGNIWAIADEVMKLPAEARPRIIIAAKTLAGIATS